jgi:hypothetical protein
MGACHEALWGSLGTLVGNPYLLSCVWPDVGSG